MFTRDVLWLIVYICYGPKAVGREKRALRVTKQPSLRVTSLPTGCSKQLALLNSWQSLWCPYAQEFSPSWNARKCVQEGSKFQEFPGNLYFQKTSEKWLKSGKLKKNKTTFTLTTFKVVRVKVVFFF